MTVSKSIICLDLSFDWFLLWPQFVNLTSYQSSAAMFLKHDGCLDFPDLSLSVRDWLENRDIERYRVPTWHHRRYLWPCLLLTCHRWLSLIFATIVSLWSIFEGTARGLIHLHGGPGVVARLLLPETPPVRFLQFGLLAERLVCIGKILPFPASLSQLLLSAQTTIITYTYGTFHW